MLLQTEVQDADTDWLKIIAGHSECFFFFFLLINIHAFNICVSKPLMILSDDMGDESQKV